MAKRLLAIHVFLEPHGGDAGDGVAVIRGRHGDRVDLLADLVEHLAEVRVNLRLGVGEGRLRVLGLLVAVVERAIQFPVVDIAQCDDLADPGRVKDVALSLPADADAGEADGLGRSVSRPRGRKGVRGEKVAKGRGAAAEEGPTIVEWFRHGEKTPGVWKVGWVDSVSGREAGCNEKGSGWWRGDATRPIRPIGGTPVPLTPSTRTPDVLPFLRDPHRTLRHAPT